MSMAGVNAPLRSAILVPCTTGLPRVESPADLGPPWTDRQSEMVNLTSFPNKGKIHYLEKDILGLRRSY